MKIFTESPLPNTNRRWKRPFVVSARALFLMKKWTAQGLTRLIFWPFHWLMEIEFVSLPKHEESDVKTGRILLLSLLSLVLCSCATPNIKPWAESTAKLSTAVSTEQSAVVTRMEATQVKIKTWDPGDSRVKKIGNYASDYRENAKQIDAMFDQFSSEK